MAVNVCAAPRALARRDLKRHLLSVEEKSLESLAWQQGSSLYTALMAAHGTLGSGAAAEGGAPGAQPQGQPQERAAPHSNGTGGEERPPKRRRGAAGAESSEDSEMADAAASQAGPQPEQPVQPPYPPQQQPDLCREGRLPLSLGHDPPAAAPATAPPGTQEQQHQQELAAAAAASQHAADIRRGDRSARAAVSWAAHVQPWSPRLLLLLVP